MFRQVRPTARLGFFTGAEKNAYADVVFASVQTLQRHLSSFGPGDFEYIVVDEFHHALPPARIDVSFITSSRVFYLVSQRRLTDWTARICSHFVATISSSAAI